ncbi:MAG: putative 2-aminoethylphosphonate ABC transporter ATP-binding protein, partial [Betaproteobacteria bacterium]
MTGDAPYLRLDGIHKSFGKFEALRDIALDVTRGELMVFLGPSGCGKTTLLRIVAGLETQDRGLIVHDGRDISRLPAIRRDYGIVFQSYALFPNLTIRDNVGYGLVNRRQGRKRIEARVHELLTLVGLPDSGFKYPGQLSGGQQQRIALARALAAAPGLLLLDEPLSALDALERVRLRGEVRALQQRLGVTTIMVTHDQEEALSMADRIVVMNAGRIEQVGTPREIYGLPATPFVADFVGKINVLPAVAEGGGQFRVGTISLAVDCRDFAAGTAVKLYLRPEEIAVNANGTARVNALAAKV